MFRGCKLLKYINLPISFTLYNEYMLGDCNNLDYIQCPVSIPPSLTISAFSNTNNCPIYVPVESINTYKTASGWSTYADRITRPNLTADVTLTVHFKTSDDTEVSTKTYTILSGTPSYYEISSNDLIDGYKNDTALIDLSTGTSVEYTVATYSIVTYTVTKHFTDGSGNTVKIDETESFSVGNGKYNEVTVSTTTTEIIYNSETINITNNYQKITLTANTDITFVYKKQLITWSGNWTQNNISTYGANSYKSDAVADSGSSVERITVTGVTTLVLSCRSYGESGYDYLTVGNIDTSCTRSTYLYSLINKSSATTWYDYTYTFSDIGTHYIEVCYSKDSGGIAGDDAAYVYVKSYS